MQYEGDEGIRENAGTAVLDKPIYSKTSDEDILGIDSEAPELGDLGEQPENAAETKQADKGPRTVKVDDENKILEDGDEPAKPVEEAKTDEKPDVEKKAKAEEAKPEEPLTPPKVSEELKSHFADPKVGKELKTAFYTAAAYKEIFPDFQQAREIAELFTSAEEAKHVSESYQGFRELQEAYESDPTQFVDKLHEEGAEEFSSIAQAVFDRLPQLDAKAYQQIGHRVMSDTLAYVLDHADEIARASGFSAENLLAAADVLSMNLFGGKKARDLVDAAPDLKDQKISKLETDLKNERSSKAESTTTAFLNDVLSEADTQIDKAVEAQLEVLLSAEGTVVSKAARQKMGEEIKAEVAGSIRSNKRVGDQVVDLIKAKGGDYGQAHLKQASAPLVQAANLAIRKAAARVVPLYTREILKTHEEKIDKQRQAASRKDAGGGGGPRVEGRGSPVTPDQIDYGRTSPEDIMNDRITLKR